MGKLLGELTVRQSPILTQAPPLVNALNQVYFAARYPGFDLDDPDWPALREQVEAVEYLLQLVKQRVMPPAAT